MKKQILTIVSILVLSTFAHAKKCTAENVGNSPKGTPMQTTWLNISPDGSFTIAVNYIGGRAKGTVTLKAGSFVKQNILVGVSNSGHLIYDDPEDQYGSYEVPCSMNEDNNVMTTGGDVQFVLRSSFPMGATHNGYQPNTDPNHIPAQQHQAPPTVIQSNSGKNIVQ